MNWILSLRSRMTNLQKLPKMTTSVLSQMMKSRDSRMTTWQMMSWRKRVPFLGLLRLQEPQRMSFRHHRQQKTSKGKAAIFYINSFYKFPFLQDVRTDLFENQLALLPHHLEFNVEGKCVGIHVVKYRKTVLYF